MSLRIWCLVLLTAVSVSCEDIDSDTVDLGPAQVETIIDEGSYYITEQDFSKAQPFVYTPPDATPAPVRHPDIQNIAISGGSEGLPVDSPKITEGDIMMDRHPEEDSPLDHNGRRKRAVYGNKWPGGVIPYEINPSYMSYTANELSVIEEAMGWWQKHTCVRFVRDDGKLDRVRMGINHQITLSIANNKICSSYVGLHHRNLKQLINLESSRCFSSAGTVAHELGHVLGLIHEQSREDRDEHINLKASAISEQSLGNFVKTQNSQSPGDVPYDLASIMHYQPNAFAKTFSVPTMTAKNLAKQSLMGQRDALGYYDIKAVNYHYGCQKRCPGICQNEGYPHYSAERRKCVCICPEGLSGAKCEKIDSNCGGLISLRAGQRFSLSSDTYLKRYRSSRKCIWLFTAPNNYLISVDFTNFNVQKSEKGSQQCVHQVEIRNNILGQRGDTFCGSGPMGKITTELGIVKKKLMIILDMSDSSLSNDDRFTATVSAYTDSCSSSPCLRGSTCENTGYSYRCICPPGYTGARCDQVTDGAVSCGFAKGLCAFSQGINDDLDFHRYFLSNRYGQLMKRSSEGNMYFIAAPSTYSSPPGSTTTLLSPTILSTTRSRRCLEFSYFFNPADQYQNGQLSVDIISSSTNQPIRNLMLITKQSRLPPADSGGWRGKTIQIDLIMNYKVKFTFTTDRRRPYNAMAGLDDISLMPQRCNSSPCDSNPCQNGAVCAEDGTSYRCLCQPGRTGATCQYLDTDSFTCDFNSEDLCGWTQDKTDDYEWVKTFGASDALKRTGPVRSVEGDGHYMVAESSQLAAQNNKKARLISPALPYHRDGICVSFYYHMYGREVGLFQFLIQASTGYRTPAFSKSGTQSTTWLHKELYIPSHTATQGARLVFEATVGQRHYSDIAVDNVKISVGSCSQKIELPAVRIPQPSPTTIPRPTPRSTTAPWYHSWYTTSARIPVTQTHTPTRPTTSPPSLPVSRQPVHRFHQLIYRQQVQQTPRVQVQSTTQQPSYTKSNRNRPRSSKSSKSLSQRLQRLAEKVNRRNNSQPTSSSSINYSCDFDQQNLCMFTSETSAENQWRIGSGSTPSHTTGPDQALSGDYYAFVEATGTRANSRAMLVSPRISPNVGDLCLSYFVHRYGVGIGEFHVYQRFSDGSIHYISSERGASDRGNVWIGAKSTVHNSNSLSFQVVLETVRSDIPRYYFGDIALDNLSIHSGRC